MFIVDLSMKSTMFCAYHTSFLYGAPQDVHRLAATVTEPSTERNTQILSQAAAQQRSQCICSVLFGYIIY